MTTKIEFDRLNESLDTWMGSWHEWQQKPISRGVGDGVTLTNKDGIEIEVYRNSLAKPSYEIRANWNRDWIEKERYCGFYQTNLAAYVAGDKNQKGEEFEAGKTWRVKLSEGDYGILTKIQEEAYPYIAEFYYRAVKRLARAKEFAAIVNGRVGDGDNNRSVVSYIGGETPPAVAAWVTNDETV